MSQRKNLLIVLGEWWEAREESSTRTPSHSRHIPRWLPTPGNAIFSLVLVFSLLWAQNVGALNLGAATAGISTSTIAYQGRLADSTGTPLTDTLNMSFRLYGQASGNTPLWTEQWTGSNGVQVSDGLFNVMLGSLDPIPQNIITGNDNLFLGISVGTDDEMSPRVQLGSVPFAVQALTVPDGSITSAKLASDVSLVPPDGSITTEKIADGAVQSRNLSIGSGTSCLSDHAKFNTPAGVKTVVPGLNLSLTLDAPSKVLIWMDGIAHSVQGSPENQDIGYFLMLDGTMVGESLDVDSNYWKDLKATRLVNVAAGTHNIGISVLAHKPAAIWLWGAPNNGLATCIYYLVLGS